MGSQRGQGLERLTLHYCDPHLWLFLSFSSSVRGVDVEQILQPWVYRREPTLHCGVISSPSQTMRSDSVKTHSTHRTLQLTACFLFTDHRLRHLTCAAVWCSLPPAACTHTLRGAQPSSSHSHTMDAVTRYLHCLVFLTYTGTVLTTNTFCPLNWDLVFSLLNISYISFCTRTCDCSFREYSDKTAD